MKSKGNTYHDLSRKIIKAPFWRSFTGVYKESRSVPFCCSDLSRLITQVGLRVLRTVITLAQCTQSTLSVLCAVHVPVYACTYARGVGEMEEILREMIVQQKKKVWTFSRMVGIMNGLLLIEAMIRLEVMENILSKVTEEKK